MTRESKRDRVEGLVYALCLALLALQGAAGAFQHTHDTAVDAGVTAPAWLAWTMAGTPDLLAIAATIALRRRHRAGVSTRLPLMVLTLAVLVLVGAQLAQAEPTPAGYWWAAWPATAFLAVVLLVETEPAKQTRTRTTRDPRPAPAPAPVVTAPQPAPAPAAAPAPAPRARTAREDCITALVATYQEDPDHRASAKALALEYGAPARTVEGWITAARKRAGVAA